MISQKDVLMMLPSTSTAPSAVITISETSSAYSSRSCPASDRPRRMAAACLSKWSGMCLLPEGSSAARCERLYARPCGKREAASRGIPPHDLALQLRRHQVRGDLVEDRGRVLAGRRDGSNRDERDEGHEQRVFQQVLTRIVLAQFAQQSEQLHDFPSS